MSAAGSTYAHICMMQTKEQMGDIRFKSTIEAQISYCKQQFATTKAKLVEQGVPEDRLGYIVANNCDTHGGFFYNEKPAIILIEQLRTCSLTCPLAKCTYRCLTVDRTDLTSVYNALQDTWDQAPEEWKKYVEKNKEQNPERKP